MRASVHKNALVTYASLIQHRKFGIIWLILQFLISKSSKFLIQKNCQKIQPYTQKWPGEVKASPAQITSLSAIGAALQAMMAIRRMVATLPHPHLLEWLMRASNEVVVLSEVCPNAFIICSPS
jgi:hypothetical protein